MMLGCRGLDVLGGACVPLCNLKSTISQFVILKTFTYYKCSLLFFTILKDP